MLIVENLRSSFSGGLESVSFINSKPFLKVVADVLCGFVIPGFVCAPKLHHLVYSANRGARVVYLALVIMPKMNARAVFPLGHCADQPGHDAASPTLRAWEGVGHAWLLFGHRLAPAFYIGLHHGPVVERSPALELLEGPVHHEEHLLGELIDRCSSSQLKLSVD